MFTYVVSSKVHFCGRMKCVTLPLEQYTVFLLIKCLISLRNINFNL